MPLQNSSEDPEKYFKYIHLFPMSVFVLLPLSVGISYAIAIGYGHVVVLFPFISDTGALPPESCIFGQLINICALLAAISIYLRHRQIMVFYQYTVNRYKIIIIVSKVLMWVGFTAAIGLSLVANFQENRVFYIHVIGAFMTFGVGGIYAWGQTAISFVMRSTMCPIWLAVVRLLLCVGGTGFLTSMSSCGGLHYKEQNFTFQLPSKVYQSDETYPLYICSTVSEWFMALALDCYFLTFVVEFRRCRITGLEMDLTIPQSELPKSASSTTIPRPRHTIGGSSKVAPKPEGLKATKHFGSTTRTEPDRAQPNPKAGKKHRSP